MMGQQPRTEPLLYYFRLGDQIFCNRFCVTLAQFAVTENPFLVAWARPLNWRGCLCSPSLSKLGRLLVGLGADGDVQGTAPRAREVRAPTPLAPPTTYFFKACWCCPLLPECRHGHHCSARRPFGDRP
jgi:hypothetical protein